MGVGAAAVVDEASGAVDGCGGAVLVWEAVGEEACHERVLAGGVGVVEGEEGVTRGLGEGGDGVQEVGFEVLVGVPIEGAGEEGFFVEDALAFRDVDGGDEAAAFVGDVADGVEM